MTKSKKVENQESTTEKVLNWVEELSKKGNELVKACYKKEGKAVIILAADSEVEMGYVQGVGDPHTTLSLLMKAASSDPYFRDAMKIAIKNTEFPEPVTETEETKSEAPSNDLEEDTPEWQKRAKAFYEKAGETIGEGKDDKGFLLIAADMPNKKATMQIGGDARTIAFMLGKVMKDHPALLERMEMAIARAKVESLLGF